MPNPAIALVGASVGGSVVQANAAKKAGSAAAAAQTDASNAQIAEQRRQFDMVRTLLQPYVDAGGKGLTGMLDLIGLNGNQSQQGAIDNIANGSEYQTLTQQAEEAILANASATGGLRGGDTQRALAGMRPEILNNLVNQQYSRLGGLMTTGQNSAAGVGAAGQNMANSVSQALGSIGQAQAGAALASGQATSNAAGGIAGTIGNVLGSIQPPANAGLFDSWGF